MDSFEIVRRRAQQWHDAAANGDTSITGWELVQRAARQAGYGVLGLVDEDVLLSGAEAVLDRGVAAIFFKRSVPEEERCALVAHELGHLALHEGASASCLHDDVDVSAPDEPSPVGIQRIEAYGQRERTELQANVFARELLLPRPLARRLFIEDSLRAREIAAQRVLPLDLVRQQLCDALLIPEEDEEVQVTQDPATQEPVSQDTQELRLDPSQREAAEHRGTPLLLEAGPGTGKTRTLVARIVHLIRQGVEPSSILALTFSNKAAMELTDRVAEQLPDEAPLIWTGTFHAFGLELLRKHHELVGLEPEVRVLDRSDAIHILEDRLPTLGLRHHQNLYEPALELREILDAVSRAKDELVDAARYRELADAMLERAFDEQTQKAAERAREVAHVYRVYEQTLKTKKAVDFGDLVMTPTRLLEQNTKLRGGVQLRYRHVLVDEYQDVNRASARFLQMIAGSGQRLWVVGDARQSIYRFRGASSANMGLFSQDFPRSERKALAVNYRSGTEVVWLFSSFSRSMQASRGQKALDLTAQRGAQGTRPDVSVVPDNESETSAIAGRIRALEAHGVPLSDQAVLCRSNTRLSEIAQGLEARGISVLHLGSLFERDEVRDMMALLSLFGDSTGAGLMRIATLPGYDVPLEDVRTFLQGARKSKTVALDALRADGMGEGLSPAGIEGLRRLALDLDGLERSDAPWTILAEYLFERSNYITRILGNGEPSAEGRMRAVGLFQFLSFSRGPVTGGGRSYPARRFLEHVRRLVLLAEERDLRQIPAPALHLDAVRLLTIHGSKGLEFEAVHIPSLQTGGIPSQFRSQRCPPPDGMITRGPDAIGEDPVRADHHEEEECLFFVALSRARTHLHLYRSESAGSMKRKGSPFLQMIVPRLPEIQGPVRVEPGENGSGEADVSLVRAAGDIELRGGDVTLYDRCPRRFFYSRIFGLRAARRDGAFVKTHRCLYEVIDALRETPGGTVLDRAKLRQRFDNAWQRRGPRGHAFELQYRVLAESILENLLRSHDGVVLEKPEPLVLESGGAAIHLQPDVAIRRPDGSVLLRLIRTGKKGAFKGEDMIHGMFQESARLQYGDRVTLEVLHLTDGGRTEISLSERKVGARLEKSGRYVRRIVSGHFPATPDPVSCPRCPFFFVCPAVPSGTLRWDPAMASFKANSEEETASDEPLDGEAPSTAP